MDMRVSIIFSINELWMLQVYVRDEAPQHSTWKFPPASLELNDQIAAALYFCTKHNEQEAPLLLSRGDCLVIDALVPQKEKDVDGNIIGKHILLSSYAARDMLLNGDMLIAEQPTELSRAEITAKINEHKRYSELDEAAC